MAKFRHKPLVIEAIQYKREENISAVQDFFGKDNGTRLVYQAKTNEYVIKNGKFRQWPIVNDWIIKEQNGDYHLCNPERFAEIFEAVND